MFDLKLKTLALAALLLLVPILMAACGDDDTDAGAGLSREEVQEIVRPEVASSPAPAQPGVSREEVEAAVQAAISGMPEPEAGLTQADVEAAIQAAMEAMPQPEPGLTEAMVEEFNDAFKVVAPSCLHGGRSGVSGGSGAPARCVAAYPPATAATPPVRTVPGAAFPAPPGTPGDG